MDINLVIKGIALLIAVVLLLSNFDLSYLFAKFFIKDTVENAPDDDINPKEDSLLFLKTVELWFLLKKKCDECKLVSASQKLDEVFPLLNDNLEDK